MKILVADRDMSLGRLYQEELEEMGHKVIFMYSGEKLAETIARRKPDVLILGSRLPDIAAVDYSSVELLARLKANFPELKVIYNSSIVEFRAAAKQAGADYCITKSSDLTDMRDAVQEIAQQKDNKPVR